MSQQPKSILIDLPPLVKAERGTGIVLPPKHMPEHLLQDNVFNIKTESSAPTVAGQAESQATVATGSQKEAEIVKVLEAVSNAQLGYDAVVPPGYILGRKDIQKENPKQKGEFISFFSAPLLISSRAKDISDGTEVIELSWHKDNRWHTKMVSRKTIAGTREIVELANYGLPVNSLNASAVIQYLHDYEKANTELPLISSSSKLGWQNDDVFLWGSVTITSPEYTGVVTFHGQDAGAAQVLKAYCAKGDAAKWYDVVSQLYNHPKAISMLFVSLATPFMQVLGVANFIADLAGETSKGKTISLRIAISAWGNPDERSSSSAIHTWDNTRVWLERLATMLNGLPLALDDTKTASDHDLIGDLLYRLPAGKGRGRGTPTGTQQMGYWRTVTLSTGEQSAVEYSKRHGGTRARVLSVRGAPFGSENLATLVRELNRLVLQNYGHSGPEVVKFILDHKEDWPLWQEAYLEMQEVFSAKAGDNSIADRLGDIFAFLAVTIPLIHAALPQLKPSRPIAELLEILWEESLDRTEEAGRHLKALQTLWDWAVSNPDKFWGKHQTDSAGNPKVPHSGWAGVWNTDRIAITTATLERVLKEYELDAILTSWADRKWLILPKGKGRMVSTRIQGKGIGCYCLKVSTIMDELKLETAPEENTD